MKNTERPDQQSTYVTKKPQQQTETSNPTHKEDDRTPLPQEKYSTQSVRNKGQSEI